MKESERPLNWQMRLRLALLVPGTHKWNAWVRDCTAWLEKPYTPHCRCRHYPMEDGDFTVIGPHCFTLSAEPSVISYRGENYYTAGDNWVHLSPRDLYGLVYEAAGAATRPLLEDHPHYVFPSERVSEAVQYVIDTKTGVPAPEGYRS